MLKVLIPIDGSDNSLRALKLLIKTAPLYRDPAEIHLLNVQPPFPGSILGVGKQAKEFHHDKGIKALAAARKMLDDAGVKYVFHIIVGEVGEVIARFVKDMKIDQIVMGTRGLGSITGMLLGAVATKVLHVVKVPVLLVK